MPLRSVAKRINSRTSVNSLIGVAFYYRDAMNRFISWASIIFEYMARVFFDLRRSCMSSHDLNHRYWLATLITTLQVG